jgi:murein DD-endopeptidase MepM/ murein hydrolase activator NlpD
VLVKEINRVFKPEKTQIYFNFCKINTMAEENRQERNWKEKLQHNYRLVVMNHETFEEVGSYKLTLLNVYMLAFAAIVLIMLITVSTIAFTPIKRLIPGYGDVSENKELMRLNQELDALQKEVEAQAFYNNNIRRILVGEEMETADDLEQQASMDSIEAVADVNPIVEDELLRKEVELDEQLIEKEILAKSVNYITRDVPLEQLYFVPPITGVVSSVFDRQSKHYGIDVIAPKNTPVKSVMDGFVFSSDWTLETGNVIGIQHSNNLITFYKHNSALLKSVGDYVKAGEAIAIIGNTGELSDGPHLHFEMWHKGKPINPSEYIFFD